MVTKQKPQPVKPLEARQKDTDDTFLGLPGLHQTVARQSQYRQHLLGTQSSSHGDPNTWRDNADHKWWEKK